jgi:hypothetical protein
VAVLSHGATMTVAVIWVTPCLHRNDQQSLLILQRLRLTIKLGIMDLAIGTVITVTSKSIEDSTKES